MSIFLLQCLPEYHNLTSDVSREQMLTSRVLLPLRHQVESVDVDAFEAAFRFEVVEEDAGEDETGAVVDGVEATVDDGGVAARTAREVGIE